jgi:hypothetical protein
MLAVGGQPIEVLGTVVDGVKAPEKSDAVLQAMAPVGEEIAEENDFDCLKPPGLMRDGFLKLDGDDAMKDVPEAGDEPEECAAPEEISTKEKAEIGGEVRAEETLAGFGGKGRLEGAKDQAEQEEAAGGGECERCDFHGGVGWFGCVVGGEIVGRVAAEFSMIGVPMDLRQLASWMRCGDGLAYLANAPAWKRTYVVARASELATAAIFMVRLGFMQPPANLG